MGCDANRPRQVDLLLFAALNATYSTVLSFCSVNCTFGSAATKPLTDLTCVAQLLLGSAVICCSWKIASRYTCHTVRCANLVVYPRF